MAQNTLVQTSEIVKKSNALARASWAVKSVYEPRLVALVASRVQASDQDFQTYQLPIRELLGEAQDGRTYQLVSEVIDNLMGRVITIQQQNGWEKYNVFSKCKYDRDKGTIEVRFDPDLKEHFLGLKSHFTKYSLFEFLILPSIYSQRLFEVLKSWDDKPEVTISLQELFTILNVPKSLQRYPDFRRYVLEKAHKDINGKTTFYYEWQPIKMGRAVSSIKFVFSSKQRTVVKESNDTKQIRTNNKLFVAAVECFKSGECEFKAGSKKCAVCRRVNGPSAKNATSGA